MSAAAAAAMSRGVDRRVAGSSVERMPPSLSVSGPAFPTVAPAGKIADDARRTRATSSEGGPVRVIQVAQRAENLDRAAEFYSALLGTRPLAVFDPPGLLFFNLDGVRLLLERGAPPSLIYLDVPDVRRLMNELEARGVEVVAAPAGDLPPRGFEAGPRGNGRMDGFHQGQRRQHGGTGQPAAGRRAAGIEQTFRRPCWWRSLRRRPEGRRRQSGPSLSTRCPTGASAAHGGWQE